MKQIVVNVPMDNSPLFDRLQSSFFTTAVVKLYDGRAKGLRQPW